jgi:hypothetical protein
MNVLQDILFQMFPAQLILAVNSYFNLGAFWMASLKVIV